MRKYITTIVLLAVTLLAAGTIDLEQAWEIGLQNNPMLQQREIVSKIAEAEQQIKFGAFLPKLTVNGLYYYVSEQAEISFANLPFGVTMDPVKVGRKDNWDFSAKLTQPVFTGFRIWKDLERAEADHRIAAQARTAAENAIRLQIAAFFYQCEAIRHQISIIDDGIRRANLQKNRVLDLLEAGQVTTLDTLAMSNRVLELVTMRKSAEHEYRIAKARLAEVMAMNEPFTLDFDDKAPISETAALETYQVQALERRVELSMNRDQILKQKLTTRIAESVFYPQIYAQAEYHYGIPGVQMIDAEWDDYYRLGVQMQWQVWDWMESAKKRKQSIHLTEKLELEEDTIANQIMREVTQTWEQLKSLEEQMGLQQQLAAQMELEVRHAENLFQEGNATMIDVRDAEERLTEAQLRLDALMSQLKIYQVQMDYYTGIIGGIK